MNKPAQTIQSSEQILNIAELQVPTWNRKYYTSPEYLERAKPFSMPAKLADSAEVIFFGGLGGNGHHWRELALQVNDNLGLGIEVFALKGQDGSREGLVSTRAADWIADVSDKIKAAAGRSGKPPVVVAASTGGMAVAQGVVENSLKLAGLVMMGPPYSFKNQVLNSLLPILSTLDATLPVASSILKEQHWPPIKTYERALAQMEARGESEDPDKLMPRPFPALLEMERLRKSSWKILPQLKCPCMLLFGTGDEYLSEEAARKTFDRIGAIDKVFESFDAPHVVGRTPNMAERERYLSVLQSWIAARAHT